MACFLTNGCLLNFAPNPTTRVTTSAAKMFNFAALNNHTNAYKNFIDLEDKWTNLIFC